MGWIKNLMVRGIVDAQNKCQTVFAGEIPLTGNVFLVGDSRKSGKLQTSAEYWKEEVIYRWVEQSSVSGRGGVCFYQEQAQPVLQFRQHLPEDVYQSSVIFGFNASYDPLCTIDSSENSINSMAGAKDFFSHLVRAYNTRRGVTDHSMLINILSMLINMLGEANPAWVGYRNLDIIVRQMCNSGDVYEFSQYLDRTFGPQLRIQQNYLELNWDNYVNLLHPFWSELRSAIGQYGTNANAERYSLRRGFSENRVCICGLREEGMLRDVLRSELLMIGNSLAKNFDVISYHVPMDGFESLISKPGVMQLRMVSQTFSKLGIESFSSVADPTVVCMGVSPQDADQLLNSLVATGRWIRFTMGDGKEPHYGVSEDDKKSIRPSDLTAARVRDGEAFFLRNSGPFFSRSIRMERHRRS